MTPAADTPCHQLLEEKNDRAKDVQAEQSVVPYDENLLERSRTQWQFGDWQSLAQLDRETLQHHPDRAKLALLAASGRLQTGDQGEARLYLRLAKDWGVSAKLLCQVIASGVHNSLGRAAAISGQEMRALVHFKKSISTGMPGGEINLLAEARASTQIAGLGVRFAEAALPYTGEKEHRPQHAQLTVASAPEKQKKQEEKAVTKKTAGDAEIDNMLNDLRPFFSGKLITYVDVGAYVGEVFLKIHESKAIKVREAHLYEPNPTSFKKLKANLESCRVHSLHVCNFAISSQSGEKQFSAAGGMTKMLRVNVDGDKATGVFNAQSYALDDLASTYTDGHIDLLKIDVEGAELDVLDGAKGLLREQRIDVIYIEAGLNRHGTQQTYLAAIDTVLQDHGYRIFKIYEQVNERMQDSPLLRRCNCAYMSSHFAEANPLKKTLELAALKQEVAELRRQLKANGLTRNEEESK